MPIYTKNNLAVLFMHIPKTGGTSIEDWLKAQEKFKEHLFMKHPPAGLLCTPQHFTYSTIESLFLPIFPTLSYQFTIVRNPYERLESEFFYRHKLRQLGLGNRPEKFFSSWVCKMLKETKRLPNLLDNHLRPQVEFISKDIEIFRFEQGISDIMNQVAERIEAEKPHNVIHKKSSNRIPVYWSLQAIHLVNDFYKSDFESFNYQHKRNSSNVFVLLKDVAVQFALTLTLNARSILRNLKT